MNPGTAVMPVASRSDQPVGRRPFAATNGHRGDPPIDDLDGRPIDWRRTGPVDEAVGDHDEASDPWLWSWNHRPYLR